MNMPKSHNDKHAPDADDMFDFLADDASGTPGQGRRGPRPVDAGPGRRARAASRVMPIIRKPVPLERQQAVRQAVSQSGVQPGAKVQPARQASGQRGAEVDEFDFLETSRSASVGHQSGFEEDWRSAHQGANYDPDEPESHPLRWLMAGIILSLLGAGAWVAWPLLFDGSQASSSGDTAAISRQDKPGSDTDASGSGVLPSGSDAASEEATGPTADEPGDEGGQATGAPSPSRMAQRFQAELGKITALVEGGQLKQAEEALTALDRSVYGYGAAEFQVLEARIREQLDAQGATAERAAEAQRQEEASRQAERDQLAELERQAEAERQAAAQRQAQLEQESAERAAAEAAREAEAARQLEVDRAATERAQAEARAEARAATRAATEGEQQAERDRQAGAERQALAERRAAEVATAQQSTAEPANTTVPITDDDLQTVYGQFVALKQAIEARDIAAVAQVTKPSGLRIQQFLQVFENSSAVRSRIVGVAARPASGSISGTLRIDAIVRSDGTEVSPPSTLSLITLSSTRESGGWSAVSW